MKKIFLPFLFLLLAIAIQAQSVPVRNNDSGRINRSYQLTTDPTKWDDLDKLMIISGFVTFQPSTNLVRRGLNASKGSTCTLGSIYTATDTGHLFTCPAGTWVDYGTGGSTGTVGSGITGQIPYYAASGTTLTATSQVFIDSSNTRVAVGNVAPTGFFHATSTAATELTHEFVIEQISNGTALGAKIGFKSANGTPGSLTRKLSGESIGYVEGAGYTGSAYASSVGMKFFATENFDGSHSGSEIRFFNSLNASFSTRNRLVIANDGHLAIGTQSNISTVSTNANSTLNVAGDIGFQSETGVATDSRIVRAGVASFSFNDATTGVAAVKFGAATLTSLQPSANSITAIQFFKADGTTNILDVDSTNSRVGVGTAAPDSPFVINANTAATTAPATSTLLHISGADSTNPTLTLDGFAGRAFINFRRANGTAASLTTIAAANALGNITLSGYDGTAYSSATNVWTINALNTWTTSDHSYYQSFFTTPSASITNNEKMRLDATGNLNLSVGAVGFGSASSPTAGLAQNASAILAVTSGSGTTGTGSLLVNNLSTAGKAINYNGVATAGWGVPAIYGSGRATAQVAANASVATYTVGAADGSFEVSANLLVTTSTTHSITVTVAYTDEGNTARTLTLSFSQLTGTFLTAITNVQGAAPYEGVPLHIRCKASTSITIATTGTFTAVTYSVEGIIKQMS